MSLAKCRVSWSCGGGRRSAAGRVGRAAQLLSGEAAAPCPRGGAGAAVRHGDVQALGAGGPGHVHGAVGEGSGMRYDEMQRSEIGATLMHQLWLRPGSRLKSCQPRRSLYFGHANLFR